MSEESRTKNFMLALNGMAIIGAILMILSLFFKFTIYGDIARTGFEIFKSENIASKVYIIISLILAAIIIIFGILRILDMVSSNLFSVMFAIAGIVLIVMSIIMFISLKYVTFAGIEADLQARGIGAILFLIFSIIAGLCATGAFIIEAMKN